MDNDDTVLDPCGCCDAGGEPAALVNDPGLPALALRVDTQPGFYARMLASLPLAKADPDAAESARPLARLLTRSPDDPTVALVDACACVADVLAFYQERIANEGYLRTATERRSVLELARAIGYELKPGVAASTHLVFSVEDAPGAPGVVTLAQGLAVQSVPPQGKVPQVFETGNTIEARADWNVLRPRLLRPADMALLDTGPATASRRVLALLGVAGSFPPGTANLHTGLPGTGLHRFDPALPVATTMDAIEVGSVYFSEASGTGIAAGDLLLFSGKASSQTRTLVQRVVAVAPDALNKRVRVDIEALPEPAKPAPPRILQFFVPYMLTPLTVFAQPVIATVNFTSKQLTTTVTHQAWRERDLQAMIGIQRWHGASLVKAITTPVPAPVDTEAGAFAFGTKLGFFGNNAPRWGTLPAGVGGKPNPYLSGWDSGDTGVALGSSRTVWQDSQGVALTPTNAFLERAVPAITRKSWVVFDSPEQAAQAFSVVDAREASRADFGLSGRAMALKLVDANGAALPTQPPATFPFRNTTAHVASRQLVLAQLPIDAPINAGDTVIELDRMVIGLAVGQPLALVGEQHDVAGVQAAEIAHLSAIVHAEGRTTLTLQQALAFSYRRDSLVISANVVAASHGESAAETLGNGDAALPNQRFDLKKRPTTHTSAPTPSGIQSTLEIRVGGVLWDELPSLYGAAPDAPVYTTRIADDATMQVIFGDGVQGARLPTGVLNVAARYRSGIGADGEVAAGSLSQLRAMPLGLRGVGNPLAASGAQDPEQLADARSNAPLTLLTFDRVVSLLDYQDYARAYPGIGKARGDLLWQGGSAMVFVTVAGATGGEAGSEVLANLVASIAAASDPSQRFQAGGHVQRYFSLGASVAVDPRYVAVDVLAAATAALVDAYGFARRGLAQSVTAAEVVTTIHQVAGVIAVDLSVLLPYSDGPPPLVDTVLDAVPAFGARWNDSGSEIVAAELLLINPAAVEITEMAP